MGSRNLGLEEIDRLLISSRSSANAQPNSSRNIRSTNRPEWGNYTPYCNGLIVLGPEKDNLVCSISGLIFLGVAIAMQFDLLVEHVGKFDAVTLITIYILTSASFLITSLSDPGVIPKHQQLSENWFEQERYKKDAAGGHRPRYCRKCETIRPPRTYHCDICGVCVRRQDMHLFIGGICIGERNFAPYMVLNTLQVILGCYLVTLNAVVFSKFSGYSRNSAKANPKEIVITAVSFFFGFLILVAPQSGLLIFPYRLYLISKDRSFREEFRALKRLNSTRPLRKKNCWGNWFSILTTKSRVESCFRRDLRQVNDSGQRQDFLRSAPSSSYRYVRRHGLNTFTRHNPDGYDDNNNEMYQLRLGAKATPEETRQGRRHKRDLSTNLKYTAKAKRNVLCQSEPMLSHGELFPMLPGDRIRMQKNSRPYFALQRRIKRFQEVQEMPKPFVDFHVHHQTPSSLSEGSIPRTPMTPEAVNEMLQLARATQIRRLIEYVLTRDRQGLIRMARTVDMGSILGVRGGLDPDNLQIIDVTRPGHGQTRPNQIARGQVNPHGNLPRSRPVVNAPVGLTQMVAAGLLERVQGRLARHLTPENLNIIRAYHNHDSNRSARTSALRNRGRSPIGAQLVQSPLRSAVPQRLIPSPMTRTTTNREHRNIPREVTEPVNNRYGRLSQLSERPSRLRSPSHRTRIRNMNVSDTITETDPNNNLAVVCVNGQRGSTSQPRNFTDLDENQNREISE